MQVRVRYEEGAKPLVRGSSGASGYDLCYNGSSTLRLYERQVRIIPTGIFIDEMDPTLEAQVRSRSGLSLKYGVQVINSPGTIDSDYRGEIKVLLIKHTPGAFDILPGDRIAQLVFAPVFHLSEAKHLVDVRGEGGFGSTGIST